MLWAAVIFICSWIQLILDYIVAFRYYAFGNPFNFPDRWQRYNCQIYLFSANPNMIHVNGFIFCFIAAVILEEKLWDYDGGDVHDTWLWALLILAAGDATGAFFSPQDGGLITHTLVGSIIYIWFFLIFVIICGSFCCCGFYVASGGEQYGRSDPSWMRIIGTHTLCIFIMWCFLIYYIVINASMIGMYKGEHYIDTWADTWTERYLIYC